MKLTTFIKRNEKWFIELPEFIEQGGIESDLEIEPGNHALFEMLSPGKSRICLFASETPFENADKLVLFEPATPSVGGAYYFIQNFMGERMNKRIWIKDLLLLIFEDQPETIYFKLVD